MQMPPQRWGDLATASGSMFVLSEIGDLVELFTPTSATLVSSAKRHSWPTRISLSCVFLKSLQPSGAPTS